MKCFAPWLARSVLVAASSFAGGCQLVGGMMESYRQSSTRTVEAEYLGLRDKTVAVLVTADPGIDLRAPGIRAELIRRITDRLANPALDTGIRGVVPAADVIEYMANYPGWVAKPMGDTAKELDNVDVILFVELTEARIFDPGNQYLLDGAAGGTVSVLDTTDSIRDNFDFQRVIQVKFPDSGGYGPDKIPPAAVATELTRRFVDRATWLFYPHEEPYYPKY